MNYQLDEIYQRAKELSDTDGFEAVVAELLGHYVTNVPDHSFAWFLLGDALRAMGRAAEAESALLTALRLAPAKERFVVHARLGMLMESLGNRDDADQWFSLALQNEEAAGLGWLWTFRGCNLASKGDLKSAEMCYREALKHECELGEVYLNLGYVLRSMRRYDEAIVALEESLKTSPDCAEASACLAGLRHINEALRMIDRSAE